MCRGDAGLLDVGTADNRATKEERLGKALEGRLKTESSGNRGSCPSLSLLHLSCAQV